MKNGKGYRGTESEALLALSLSTVQMATKISLQVLELKSKGQNIDILKTFRISFLENLGNLFVQGLADPEKHKDLLLKETVLLRKAFDDGLREGIFSCEKKE